MMEKSFESILTLNDMIEKNTLQICHQHEKLH